MNDEPIVIVGAGHAAMALSASLADAGQGQRVILVSDEHELPYQRPPLSKGLLSLDTNPVPIKTAMQILGRDSGAVRLPLVGATAATQKIIAELLHHAGLMSGQRGVTQTERVH